MSTKLTMSAGEIAQRMTDAYGGETQVNLRAVEKYVAQQAYRIAYNAREDVKAKRKEYMQKRAQEQKNVRAMIAALTGAKNDGE